MQEEVKLSTSDPRHHTKRLKEMLTQVIDHARSDVSKISDPKARALFETTAEALIGLRKAFEDFESGTNRRGSEPVDSRQRTPGTGQSERRNSDYSPCGGKSCDRGWSRTPGLIFLA